MEINHLLKPKHYFAGMRLQESEELILLTRKGDVLATFSATGATLENILLEANKYVEDGE